MINIQNDAGFGLSWTLCTIFKIYGQFSKIAIFEKIVKIPFLQNVNYCSVFQDCAPSCSHAHNELVYDLVNQNSNLEKKMCFYVCIFFYFYPKN